ncbi:uncharacterized protein LOC143856693 [Tasmannia lanceolata]|uniref:uncharacterized protein LOC143856693 n=1 Tax=Tasmannia lanceolata TaxID=3420 RepID=UPI004063FEA4
MGCFGRFQSELRSVGHYFSWSNNSSAENLKLRRLHRCLVNEEWLCSFPISIAKFKNSGPSDHSPILFQLDNKEIGNSKRPFRFHNMWLEDLSLFEVVEKAWAIKIKGNPMFRVIKKLKEVKRSIKEWNNNIFGQVDILLPIARENLDIIKTQLSQDPATPN